MIIITLIKEIIILAQSNVSYNFFMLIRRGSWPNIKITFINDSLQFIMKPYKCCQGWNEYVRLKDDF